MKCVEPGSVGKDRKCQLSPSLRLPPAVSPEVGSGLPALDPQLWSVLPSTSSDALFLTYAELPDTNLRISSLASAVRQSLLPVPGTSAQALTPVLITAPNAFLLFPSAHIPPTQSFGL